MSRSLFFFFDDIFVWKCKREDKILYSIFFLFALNFKRYDEYTSFVAVYAIKYSKDIHPSGNDVTDILSKNKRL